MVDQTHGKIVFVGDGVTALGFRLAGVQICVPSLRELEATLASLRQQAALVILTAQLAEQLPARALRGAGAVVLVIESARGEVKPPDLSRRARQQLGILS